MRANNDEAAPALMPVPDTPHNLKSPNRMALLSELPTFITLIPVDSKVRRLFRTAESSYTIILFSEGTYIVTLFPGSVT
jgi:hypothetical protein